MKIKKSSSFLTTFVISALIFTFTACEEEKPGEPGDVPTPKPVTGLAVGQVNSNTLQVVWDHSADKDSSYFKEYEVTITNSANSGSDKMTVAKSNNYLNYTANANATYTFTIVAVNTEDVSSTTASISWALASHFTQTENDQPINVYCKESANYGSGLQLYGPNNAPRIRRVANGTEWNIAVGSKDNLIIGSALAVASAAGYNLTGTPADNFQITDPINFDTDVLNDLLYDKSLDKLTYSSKSINLTTNSIAQSASKGIVFFAKGNSNYAKIVVLKLGGSYLQAGSSSDPYVRVLVSYQTRSNVPYAKTSGK